MPSSPSAGCFRGLWKHLCRHLFLWRGWIGLPIRAWSLPLAQDLSILYHVRISRMTGAPIEQMQLNRCSCRQYTRKYVLEGWIT